MTSISPEMLNGIIQELEPRLKKKHLKTVRDALEVPDFVEVLTDRMENAFSNVRIVSPSVVAEFEDMINDASTTERDIQKLIESNCWLLGLDYEKVEPQKKAGESHILDFRLRWQFGKFEIVELKRPNDALFVTRQGRLSKSVKLVAALEQLMEYRDYYLEHPDYVAASEGRRVYKPLGRLIMGRTHEGQEERLLFENSYLKDIRIDTYDDVLVTAKACTEIIEKMGFISD